MHAFAFTRYPSSQTVQTEAEVQVRQLEEQGEH